MHSDQLRTLRMMAVIYKNFGLDCWFSELTIGLGYRLRRTNNIYLNWLIINEYMINKYLFDVDSCSTFK